MLKYRLLGVRISIFGCSLFKSCAKQLDWITICGEKLLPLSSVRHASFRNVLEYYRFLVPNVGSALYAIPAPLTLTFVSCKWVLAKKPLSGLINSGIEVRHFKSSKGSNVYRDGVLYK